MEKDNKNNMCDIYEKSVDWYDKNRSRELFEKPYLDLIIANLKPGAAVLDLGCSMGEPIAKYFIDHGYLVTGIDGSRKMIALAASRLPTGSFLISDIRNLALDKQFDCIITWDSYFHLPRNDQRAMFSTFEKHIKPDGLLLFTSGPSDGEVWSNNGGGNLYHASLSADEYRELLSKHHFRLIKHVIEDETCRDHTVWLTKYTGFESTFS